MIVFYRLDDRGSGPKRYCWSCIRCRAASAVDLASTANRGESPRSSCAPRARSSAGVRPGGRRLGYADLRRWTDSLTQPSDPADRGRDLREACRPAGSDDPFDQLAVGSTKCLGRDSNGRSSMRSRASATTRAMTFARRARACGPPLASGGPMPSRSGIAHCRRSGHPPSSTRPGHRPALLLITEIEHSAAGSSAHEVYSPRWRGEVSDFTKPIAVTVAPSAASTWQGDMLVLWRWAVRSLTSRSSAGRSRPR